MKIFFTAGIFFLIIALQGCMPTAFVAGAFAGGVVIYDNRNIATMAEDRNITYRAQTKLNENRELRKKAHISVTSFNRVVLVVGQAPTSELRDRAITIVQYIPNIVRIYNEITIGAPISLAASTNDTWITTKVKAALLGEKGLRSAQIKILTENRAVYLMGLVTHGQGDLAAKVVQKIPGVRSVVKVFEYIK